MASRDADMEINGVGILLHQSRCCVRVKRIFSKFDQSVVKSSRDPSTWSNVLTDVSPTMQYRLVGVAMMQKRRSRNTNLRYGDGQSEVM